MVAWGLLLQQSEKNPPPISPMPKQTHLSVFFFYFNFFYGGLRATAQAERKIHPQYHLCQNRPTCQCFFSLSYSPLRAGMAQPGCLTCCTPLLTTHQFRSATPLPSVFSLRRSSLLHSHSARGWCGLSSVSWWRRKQAEVDVWQFVHLSTILGIGGMEGSLIFEGLWDGFWGAEQKNVFIGG